MRNERSKWCLAIVFVGCAAVVAGFVAPPRRSRFRTLIPAAGSHWRLDGFAQGAFLTSDPASTPADVRLFGSRVGTDDSTGTLRSPWFEVRRNFALLVSGYPTLRGNSLDVELANDGRTIPVRIDPGERWAIWQPESPPREAALRIRIVARDRTRGFRGWLGVSEPFESHEVAALPTLVRLIATTALAMAFALGPGLALSALTGRPSSSGMLLLPGFGILAATGLCCWPLARLIDPRLLAVTMLMPVLAACAWIAATRPVAIGAGEWRALRLYALVVVIAVAKATWSQGPDMELFGGTISRTLEAGDRSDARIPYHLVQLVAHGTPPYSARAKSYFAPWSFSHRGPLSGLAAAPIALLSGARPALPMPDMPWEPFDPEGFAAYRVAMISFAAAAVLAVFDLAAVIAGPVAGLVAAVVAAGTPFVVHETYFTWPKLLTAALVLICFRFMLKGRPAASGLLMALAYLVHPGALLSVPAAGLMWIVHLAGGPDARFSGIRRVHRDRRLWTGALAFCATWGAGPILWRLVNGRHFRQEGFLIYFALSAGHLAAGAADWVESRLVSIANTLVPLYAFFEYGRQNMFRWQSSAFFFQYWCAAPFGLGILALPFFAWGLARAARKSPLLLWSLVVVPLLLFAVFWGAFTTGMMREGLHAWALCIVVLCACAYVRDDVPPWWVQPLVAARALEILAMLVIACLVPLGRLTRPETFWTDATALGVMAVGCAAIARETVTILRSGY